MQILKANVVCLFLLWPFFGSLFQPSWLTALITFALVLQHIVVPVSVCKVCFQISPFILNTQILFCPSLSQVYVAGYDVRKQSHEAFQHMGFCPQEDVLWPKITLQEHLEAFARMRGKPRGEVKRVVKQWVHLSERLKAQENLHALYIRVQHFPSLSYWQI